MTIDRWMDKEDVVYSYNGILLRGKKELNLAIWNNMDGTGLDYAKQNMSEKGKHNMISLICGI